MITIPKMNLQKRESQQPYVVILGAGASFAAFPKGDKNDRLLPLMNNIISILKLEPMLEEYGVNYNDENFEAFYNDLVSNSSNAHLLLEIEKVIFTYFSEMVIPDEPTLYDYLLLSLRKKDVIATFNWDPFLSQAYLRNYKIAEMPNILFLHGNVTIGLCRACKTQGFIEYGASCYECHKPFELSKLLYPIKHKNYKKDDFIDNQWKQIQLYLSDAYMLTIFGYSAPMTDIEAKDLMKLAWQKNSLQDFAWVDIVDIKQKRELLKTWEPFSFRFSSIQKSLKSTYLFNHPRRSCEALQMATLQQNPWPDNKYPKFETLDELHDWVMPLAAEEKLDQSLSSCGIIVEYDH